MKLVGKVLRRLKLLIIAPTVRPKAVALIDSGSRNPVFHLNRVPDAGSRGCPEVKCILDEFGYHVGQS